MTTVTAVRRGEFRPSPEFPAQCLEAFVHYLFICNCFQTSLLPHHGSALSLKTVKLQLESVFPFEYHDIFDFKKQNMKTFLGYRKDLIASTETTKLLCNLDERNISKESQLRYQRVSQPWVRIIQSGAFSPNRCSLQGCRGSRHQSVVQTAASFCFPPISCSQWFSLLPCSLFL